MMLGRGLFRSVALASSFGLFVNHQRLLRFASSSTMEPDFTSADPYRIIGVNRSASKAEIKAQYYRLAKMHHPDISNGNDEVFKRLNKAYEDINRDGGVPPADAFDKKQEDAWKEWKRAAKGFGAQPPKQKVNRPEHMDYQQIREWFVLSSGFRSPADNKLFEKWIKQWSLLKVFQVAVDHAEAGGSDLLFFCDDKEKAFWKKKLEELWKDWKKFHQESLAWGQSHHDQLQKARDSLSYEQIAKAAQEFKDKFDSKTMEKKAHAEFENVKMDLMTKRSESQAASEDDW